MIVCKGRLTESRDAQVCCGGDICQRVEHTKGVYSMEQRKYRLFKGMVKRPLRVTYAKGRKGDRLTEEW